MITDQQFLAFYLITWAVFAFLALTGLHKYLVPVIKKKDLRPRGSKRFGFILIRDTLTQQEKKETLAHEYVHVKQAWLMPPLVFSFAYMIPAVQQWLETWAYAASARNGRSLDDCAASLAHNHYPGGMSSENVAKAKKAIQKRI